MAVSGVVMHLRPGKTMDEESYQGGRDVAVSAAMPEMHRDGDLAGIKSPGYQQTTGVGDNGLGPAREGFPGAGRHLAQKAARPPMA